MSGCSALIFQTLWLRLSGLAFGNSVWSAALILSSFMAGLALGNGIAARARAGRHPLRSYALLELAVGVCGCTIVFALPSLGDWLRPVFQTVWGAPAVINGLRLLLSFLILLVPTTAMGLTFPVLLSDEALRRHDFGRVVGLLYGANTLGAVAGVLIGEGLLIKAVGLWGTGLAAGSLSLAAAMVAWVLDRSGSTEIRAMAASEAQPRAPGNRPPWRLLLASLGGGCLFLCLEVVWFRFLRLYIASSPTAFSVMLATVLAGIGLGGVVSGAIHRRKLRLDRLLPSLFLGTGAVTLFCYVVFSVPTSPGNPTLYYHESWLTVGRLALVLMFPVSFLSGATFPIIVGRVQAALESPMNSAGSVTLFNTIGAAIGPLLASFIFLPRLGFQWTLVICALGYGLLALLVSEPPAWSLRKAAGKASCVMGALFVLTLALFPWNRDELHFANARRPYEADGSKLVTRIEGTADTLQLLRHDLFGEPYYYRLVTNGFSMSATHPRSQRYMRLFAWLPLVFRPESEDALLICHGVGVTADALCREGRLKRIDVVDISKEVFELSDLYVGPTHSDPLRDSRVVTHIQDGRFFLQAGPRQYDIITGEPPPLKVAGTVNLYTEEFFSLMAGRLKDDGIATFWLPIYQLKVDETKAILGAFHRAFPNTSVWGGADNEWIMMGIKGPGRRLAPDEIRRRWRENATRADLVNIGVESPEQFAALFLMDSAEVKRLTQGVKPLTDQFPKRLTDAPVDNQATYDFAMTYMQATAVSQNFDSSDLMARIWPESMRTTLQSYFVVREMRYVRAAKGSNWLADLDLYLRESRLRTPVQEVLNTDEVRVTLAERVAQEEGRPPPAVVPDLVAGALARRDIPGAIHLMEIEAARGFTNSNNLFLLIYLYCLEGRLDEAEGLAATASGSIQKDWFVDWLWQKLNSDFGFKPPGLP